MIGWIALVLITTFGAISLRYFLIRNKTLSSGNENAEAINLVSEMARIWKSDLSASAKLQRLNVVRDRIIAFDERRQREVISHSNDNVTYLNAFSNRDDDGERKRSGA